MKKCDQKIIQKMNDPKLVTKK